MIPSVISCWVLFCGLSHLTNPLFCSQRYLVFLVPLTCRDLNTMVAVELSCPSERSLVNVLFCMAGYKNDLMWCEHQGSYFNTKIFRSIHPSRDVTYCMWYRSQGYWTGDNDDDNDDDEGDGDDEYMMVQDVECSPNRLKFMAYTRKETFYSLEVWSL